MEMSEQSRVAITSALKEALCRYVSGGEESVVTDIHLQPNSESGELVIYDDDDKVLARTIINEWVEYDSDDFYAVVEPILRAELEALKATGTPICLVHISNASSSFSKTETYSLSAGISSTLVKNSHAQVIASILK